jgi:hypothetical protein
MDCKALYHRKQNSSKIRVFYEFWLIFSRNVLWHISSKQEEWSHRNSSC